MWCGVVWRGVVWCGVLHVGTAAGDNDDNEYFATFAGGVGISFLALHDVAVFAHSFLLCLLLSFSHHFPLPPSFTQSIFYLLFNLLTLS